MTAFGNGVLNVRYGLPLARFTYDEKLNIVLLERIDLLFRPGGAGKKRYGGNPYRRIVYDTNGTGSGLRLNMAAISSTVAGGKENKCGSELL